MSWRLISLTRTRHLPDTIRLWQGDSIGHWDGDALVVETTNFNGKTWGNEVGDVFSHAEHVVERFKPVDANTIEYEATITDPIVYTRPFTIAMPLKRLDRRSDGGGLPRRGARFAGAQENQGHGARQEGRHVRRRKVTFQVVRLTTSSMSSGESADSSRDASTFTQSTAPTSSRTVIGMNGAS